MERRRHEQQQAYQNKQTTAAMTTSIIAQQNNQLSGCLVVHIVAGLGLNSSQQVLKDLYCVVEVDSVRKARSMIRTSTECFDWDEVFELEIYRNTSLSLLIYQWHPRMRHRLCFYGNILLNSMVQRLNTKCVNTEKIALDLEPKGRLCVEIRYVTIEEVFQRKPASDTMVALLSSASSSSRQKPYMPQIFGVPIEELLRLEQTTWKKQRLLSTTSKSTYCNPTGNSASLNASLSTLNQIPLLILKCVEEIEMRGFDIVGIYRLNGCCSLKKKVRQIFEQVITQSPNQHPELHPQSSPYQRHQYHQRHANALNSYSSLPQNRRV